MLEIAKVLQVRVDEAQLELATRQGQRDVYIKQCAKMLGIQCDVTFDFATAAFYEAPIEHGHGNSK